MTELTTAPADIAPEATQDAPPARGFADYGVRPETVAALATRGILTPFPIQAQTLELALAGSDLIGQARTGTGKTLGFGIPMVDNVVTPQDPGYDAHPAAGKPQALVVVPTRELCIQVADDLALAGSTRGVRVAAIYGGRPFDAQIEQLDAGVEIVVGTPGRLLDLARQGHLILHHARITCLDEADEMLDMGFLPDVEKIMGLTPAGRQTMLFSATMPSQIITLARQFMTQPTHIRSQDVDDTGTVATTITQHVYRAHNMDKVEVLARILQADGRGPTIIFCRTKRGAQNVADDLIERGFAAGSIHGDLAQEAREKTLTKFRGGTIDVLVATDVAARGIDIDNVTHVINYQCPEDEKTYVHRIGRTGRAGNTGTAVTLVDWDDLHKWAYIDRELGLGLPEPVETYSTSAHLYAELSIAPGTTGRIGHGPKAPRRDDKARSQGDRPKGRSDRPRESKAPGATRSDWGPRNRTRSGR